MESLKKPVIHAFTAVVYIAAVVFLIGGLTEGRIQNSILLPILMISTFTLSAAVMGYLFLGVPIQLYLDGKKKEAVSFFGRTVGLFAAITAIILIIAATGVLG